MRFNILLLLSIWVPSWSLTEARSSAWVSGPPNGYVPAFVTANRALSIRGGGEDDREWKFYEVVPIVSAVPFAVKALDVSDYCIFLFYILRFLQHFTDSLTVCQLCLRDGMFVPFLSPVSSYACFARLMHAFTWSPTSCW
ncbi:unnamed protein product [Discosporangium mesarthrocarpum]